MWTIVTMVMLASVPMSILFIIIVLYRAPSQFKKILPLYIMAVALIAYCYNPIYENDLARYFVMLDNCRKMPFSMAFTWADDGLVVKNFLFWVIAQTGDKNLLSAITTSVLYGVSIYIVVDSFGAGGNYRNLRWLISFQLLMLPFLEAASNIRNMLSFALIILAVYRDVVKHNRNIITLLLYILPCFIHMTGFVLVLIRLAAIMAKKYPMLTTMVSVALPTLTINAYNTFYSIASAIPGEIGKIVRRAVQKAYSSSMNTSEYALSMQESGYNNACRIIILAAFLLLVFLIIRYIKKYENSDTKFAVFCLLLCDITIVWILIHTVKYWVFAVAAIVSCSPILTYYFKHYQECGKKEKICISGLKILAYGRFALELYYMSTRVDFFELGTNALLTNIYIIIGRLLARLIFA